MNKEHTMTGTRTMRTTTGYPYPGGDAVEFGQDDIVRYAGEQPADERW